MSKMRCPRIAPAFGAFDAVSLCQVLADEMALETVDAALALLQIDGIRRQIPMHERMAIGMEIEPLLPDRSRGKNEGTEGRIERVA